MRLSKVWQPLLRLALGSPATAGRQPSRRPPNRRLCLEPLEDRNLPSSYTAATVSDLIADINAANAAGGSNTIMLAAGTTFTLTAVDNTTLGATGLPVVAANDNLTLIGNGDTLERSTASGTPAFRLLEVVGGGALTLSNLTLQGGLSTDQFGPGLGGGIYSSGMLTLASCTIQNNHALGGTGYRDGSDALGGGLYVDGGTASLTNVILSGNTAQGGNGADGFQSPYQRRHPVPPGNGGNGLGGGMYVAAGTVTLRQTTVSGNTATGGTAGQPVQGQKAKDGLGEGGGLYLASGSAVSLDSFTQNHDTNNSASTSHPDIYGSFTTLI
jgi:hypothetical protein